MVNLTPLGALVARLPETLLWVLGLLLALTHWRRNPRIALLALMAFILLLTLLLVGNYMDTQLPALLSAPGNLAAGNPGMALTFSVCGKSTIAAVAWGLILLALFGGKGKGVSRE